MVDRTRESDDLDSNRRSPTSQQADDQVAAVARLCNPTRSPGEPTFMQSRARGDRLGSSPVPLP